MRKPDKHVIGIGFWLGGGVFSIINIFKIFTHANILLYDYIMSAVAVIFIILSLLLLGKKNKEDNRNKIDKYVFGISFWIGGGIFSLINMIMNLISAFPSNILYYNYLITGAAVFGLMLNLILLRKEKNKKVKS